ncbi:MAG: coenzyme A pyrophosphatase [Acidocella sp. 20-63-7]|nr:MAG: coenzyme A pyrophosphatase [Acidocella sp. 20-63-7]HQT47221.1 CoA pyrophosphatase [Acidocella sp.]
MMLDADELRNRLVGRREHVSLERGVYRPAAVLVPLEPGRGVWLTRRSALMPNHAGQVSFPGGKIEAGDVSVEAAALREAEEEIGLDLAAAEILGRMDDCITGTGFHIAPVLALVKSGVSFVAAPDEVQEVFCLPFEALLDRARPQRRRVVWRKGEREFWVWPHEEHVIWGATAEILLHLAQRLRGD